MISLRVRLILFGFLGLIAIAWFLFLGDSSPNGHEEEITESEYIAKARPPGETAEKFYQLNKAKFTGVLDQIFSENPNFKKPGPEHTHIIVSDFDHTLAETEVEIPIVTRTGETENRDSKCFKVYFGEEADFEVFTEPRLMTSGIVNLGIERTKKLMQEKGAYLAIITARSQDHTFQSAYRYLKAKGLDVSVVIPVNSWLLHQKIWLTLRYPEGVFATPRGFKKPLLMAMLLDLAEQRKAKIQKLTYLEDTDKYIGTTMLYLPLAYPHVETAIYDYVRHGLVGNRTFKEVYLGKSKGKQFLSPNGQPFVGAYSYSSLDCRHYIY